MPAIHSLVCHGCDYLEHDHIFASKDFILPNCPKCGITLDIQWQVRWKRTAAWCPQERIAVFRNPQTGEVKYPGQNDAPMPARYREQGFVKEELVTLHDATQFEKREGVMCEALHYDRNGKTDRNDPVPEVKTNDNVRLFD